MQNQLTKRTNKATDLKHMDLFNAEDCLHLTGHVLSSSLAPFVNSI